MSESTRTDRAHETAAASYSIPHSRKHLDTLQARSDAAIAMVCLYDHLQQRHRTVTLSRASTVPDTSAIDS